MENLLFLGVPILKHIRVFLLTVKHFIETNPLAHTILAKLKAFISSNDRKIIFHHIFLTEIQLLNVKFAINE